MGWYEAIKDALSAADRLRDAELAQAVANVRMEGAKLAEENARLREENIALKEAAKLSAEMKFDADLYWRTGASGQKEGPFCPRCWDGKRNAVRLLTHTSQFWQCAVCTLVMPRNSRLFDPAE